MMTLKSILRLPVLACLLGAPTAEAAISFSATLSDVDYSFTDFGYTDSSVSISSPSIPFIYDFSTVGDETLNVSVNAPAGYQFEVTAPSSGFQNVQMQFEYRFGSSIHGAGSLSESGPLVFAGGAGDLPLGYFGNVRGTGPDDGDLFRITSDVITLNPGDSFTFESLEFSVDIPSSYQTFFNADGIASLTGNAVGPSGLSDPGQWIRVVAVPEPSVTSLMLSSVVILLGRRSRR
ncbi:hypothetical protein Rhal01_01163 [Rubritalea halochordaticola]|uniref:PEP-CTERM sorting domain-containing protein n=1 Tax=Rubritalea halochordaticola TaxID=714537 RepID=A0ABP9UZ75_9BACT